MMLILARLISASCRSLASMLGTGCARWGRAGRSGSPDDFVAAAFAMVPLSSSAFRFAPDPSVSSPIPFRREDRPWTADRS